MKPVASGCTLTPQGLRNDDALTLLGAMNVRAGYSEVNPYAFAPAIAPHIAAREAGIDIDLEVLDRAYERLRLRAEVLIVEGAGGWLAPLDATRGFADLAVRWQMDIVLVVGMRLGCLNHALLTVESIERRGLRLRGWIANAIDAEFERLPENMSSLKTRIAAPNLGLLPFPAGSRLQVAGAGPHRRCIGCISWGILGCMEQRIELAPNCSLKPTGAMLFFVSTCLFSLGFALFFVFQGFWPVLLFWALEMLALGLALNASMRNGKYSQTVLITESQISLVTRSRRGSQKQEFARHWTKVRLRSPPRRHGLSRLTIESRGLACEVGSFLTEEERRRLAERLTYLVGGMNESPPIEIANIGDRN